MNTETKPSDELPAKGTQARTVVDEIAKKEAADKKAGRSADTPKKLVMPKTTAPVTPKSEQPPATEGVAPKKPKAAKKQTRVQKVAKAIQTLKEEGVQAVAVSSKRKSQPKKKENTMAKSSAKKSSKEEASVGRPSPFTGKGIKVLKRENPFREGTNRAVRLDIIFGSKSVDDAMGKKVKGVKISAKDLRRAQKLRLIKIS